LAVGCARLCVLGDFNLPHFNWNLFIYLETNLYHSAADFVCNHGLTQLVNEPTRGASILDLCTDVLCCDDVLILPPLASSDHSVVSFKGECKLDVHVVWQSDCLFYISDNKFNHIDIAFCALLTKSVIFKTFYLLRSLKWIGFYLLQLHILWWACLSLNVIGRYAFLLVSNLR